MSSGLPQIIVGSLLFSIVINDLKENIKSLLIKLAEETLIVVNSDGLRSVIQLTILVCQSAYLNSMHFNKAKCKVIHLLTKNEGHTYKLQNSVLQCSDSEKDFEGNGG